MVNAGKVRVTLADHKAVVRNWRERLPRRASPSHAQRPREQPGHDRCNSARQWHLDALTQSQENNGAASDTVNVESEADTDRMLGADDSDDDVQEAIHLRSVGQIKHAYRVRARREEVKNERVAIQRQLEKRTEWQTATKPEEPRKSPASTLVQPVDHERETEESEILDNPTLKKDKRMKLDTEMLVSSGEYRSDVLRAVRRELSAGRDVFLVAPIVSTASLPVVKLTTQQLCSDSLLFCTRDQNILPTVDHERGTVTLELLARHPQM